MPKPKEFKIPMPWGLDLRRKLSKKDIQAIIALKKCGHKTKAIAHAFNISTATVHWHTNPEYKAKAKERNKEAVIRYFAKLSKKEVREKFLRCWNRKKQLIASGQIKEDGNV